MWKLILHADAVKQVRPWTRDLSIQRARRNCKTAKNWEVFCNSSAMCTSIQGFVSEEPRGERLENNFARLFGRHLSLHAMRLAALFVGSS